jgi:SAM-dependent methyltransferase
MDLREDLAFETHTVVNYFDEEVSDLRHAEEQAVLRAMPTGYDLWELNGINVGCGDRCINDAIVGIDAHSGEWNTSGEFGQKFQSGAKLRSWSHDLPFKSNTLDYIVALHILEHEANPIEVVKHWIDIVKSGGGVGIVVPDWRYTWDSRNDDHPWGHRWNPTPKLSRALFEEYWSELSILEHLDTYRWKMSFDMVLRKPGDFVSFDASDADRIPTGRQLHTSGKFLHPDD